MMIMLMPKLMMMMMLLIMMMLLRRVHKAPLALAEGIGGVAGGGWGVNDWDQNCVNINDIKARLEIKQTTSQIQ